MLAVLELIDKVKLRIAEPQDGCWLAGWLGAQFGLSLTVSNSNDGGDGWCGERNALPFFMREDNGRIQPELSGWIEPPSINQE